MVYHNHKIHRSGWLRASVLGANDGILSTASLLLGVYMGGGSEHHLLITGLAGLVAGAMSMAAGEYVSVCSQADTEQADLEMEIRSLERHAELEKQELTEIYQQRGLTPDLAGQVADQLMKHDALGAHVRDDIGIIEHASARPLQAALMSALSFAIGAALPLMTVILTSDTLIFTLPAATLIFLALLGTSAAWIGGASIIRGATRVVLWGSTAMLVTAAIGRLFGVLSSAH